MEAKLDHIAFGVPDVAPVAELLAGHLGGRERGSGPGNGFVFWQWEFADGGAIEIIVPGRAARRIPAPLHRRARRGPPPRDVQGARHPRRARSRARTRLRAGRRRRSLSRPGRRRSCTRSRRRGSSCSSPRRIRSSRPTSEGADFAAPAVPGDARRTRNREGGRPAALGAQRRARAAPVADAARRRARARARPAGVPLARIAAADRGARAAGRRRRSARARARRARAVLALPEGPHPALSLPLVQVEEI